MGPHGVSWEAEARPDMTDVGGAASRAGTVGPASAFSRPALGLTLVILAVPVAAYLWFVAHFAVNGVYWDQWSDVSLIRDWDSGNLNVAAVWASHGDHRILFPNLIALSLARFAGFNVVVEEFLSALMVITTAIIVVVAHRRRSPSTPLILYLPVLLLFFSFVQFQNTLWGFQIAWYLVTLCLVASLYFLDRALLTPLTFVAGLLAAILASYSSLQGLIVWPAGLLLLYLRGRRTRHLLVWCATALVVLLVYFYHLNPSEYSDQTYIFTHPFASLKFFLFLIGSVTGVQLTSSPGPEIALGAAVVVVSVVLIARYWRKDEVSSRPFGLALIVYGLLFAVSITQGRAWFALWAPSRYSTCGLIVLAGCYLVLLDRHEVGARLPTQGLLSGTDSASYGAGWAIGRKTCWVALLVAVAAAVLFGNAHGYASAKSWSVDQKQVADVTVNYKRATPSLLGAELVKGNPTWSRELAQTLEEDRLSVFATADRSHYLRVGIPQSLTAIRTVIATPKQNATVSGAPYVFAGASDPSGIRSVALMATDPTGQQMLVGQGAPIAFGWVVRWDTRDLPNGRYELASVATADDGLSARSPPVSITVNN